MIHEKIGSRCRELRERMGLSQESFALKIGIDRTYYARFEAGHHNISLRKLARIANGFEISLEELFHGLGDLDFKDGNN